MDNNLKWPQISGSQPDQDYSFQKNNTQFDTAEQPIKLVDFPNIQRTLPQEFAYLKSLTEQKNHQQNCVGSDKQFQSLNRYSDMLPFHHTLVQTQANQNVTPETYINGNYISTVFNEKNAIIATQGPVDESLPAFWNMLWYNNTKLIVMLCQLKDKRGIQCTGYWPYHPQQEMKIGNYRIINESITPIGDMINLTQLKVSHENEVRILNHLLWSGWPDFGVPQVDHWPEIDKIATLMHEQILQKQPVVVHCSAGVGRTGSLISCYQTLSMLKFYETFINNELTTGKKIDQILDDPRLSLSIFSIVRRQREQRICLVMNLEQYTFVYQYAISRVIQLLKKY